MKIKVNDTVKVIAGKDKGMEGQVLKTLIKNDRVVVQGVNMRTKHVKKTAQRAGQKVTYEASVHVSNVMLLDPKSKKVTRIGYVLEKGKKVRIAKKSGAVIETVKKLEPKKEVKKETKKVAKKA